MLRFRTFLENIDDSQDRSGQLSWSPGDLSFDGPETDMIGEDERPQSFIKQFDVAHMKNNAPDHIISNDELDNQSAHRSTFLPEHNRTLKDYKHLSDTLVNNNLRLNDGYHPTGKGYRARDYKSQIANMDHITSHPTTEPMSTYRGFSESFRVDHLKPGDEFTDHGYTGTSLHKHIAGGFAGENKELHPLPFKTIAKINIPPGTKGHYLDHPDHVTQDTAVFRDEHEFTLHRGTRFQVQKHTLHKDQNTGHLYHITHLNVIGQHPVNHDPET